MKKYADAAERRMNEELGTVCKLKYLFKFEYHVSYENIGSENEICGVLIGKINNCLNYNKDEISEIKWIGVDDLNFELKTRVNNYCPWMIVALYLLLFTTNNKFINISNVWTKLDFKNTLEKSIEHYFPNKNNWRIIHDD